jgi:hypothetical protein
MEIKYIHTILNEGLGQLSQPFKSNRGVEMKQTNNDGSPSKSKRPVTPESKEKMSMARKEWWAKKRVATPKQADTSTVPIQDATVPANELNPAPVSDDGAGSGTSADNQGAPSGRTTPAKPVSAKKYAANVRNAQHSTGPQTTAGKQKSSLNA